MARHRPVGTGAGRSEGRAGWSSDDAGAHGDHDHLRPVAGAELAGDPGQVALDGQRRQAQGLADLLVGAALGDQLEHLDLTAGEPLGAGGGRDGSGAQRAGTGRREGPAAAAVTRKSRHHRRGRPARCRGPRLPRAPQRGSSPGSAARGPGRSRPVGEPDLHDAEVALGRAGGRTRLGQAGRLDDVSGPERAERASRGSRTKGPPRPPSR